MQLLGFKLNKIIRGVIAAALPFFCFERVHGVNGDPGLHGKT